MTNPRGNKIVAASSCSKPRQSKRTAFSGFHFQNASFGRRFFLGPAQRDVSSGGRIIKISCLGTGTYNSVNTSMLDH
jgi:hypothetical protein